MVWDRIYSRDMRSEPVEEWGGLGYTLEALAAGIPRGWRAFPIVKIGRDLSESSLRWLRAIPELEIGDGVVEVPEANNRVEIRYTSSDRRAERLVGGVPPWGWDELAPLVQGLDALYVNFISGFEMTLETAEALRQGFDGPIYADLHSLFLGLGAHGARIPRQLPEWERWLRCFDAVQLNDDEFDLLGRAVGDPWQLAARVVGPDLKLIVVTMGPAGAGYVASASFDPAPATWARTRGRLGDDGPVKSGRVPLVSPECVGDPTGCGDVWGATVLARMLAGSSLDEAMAGANEMAAKNVAHLGAEGLRFHLRGQPLGSELYTK